MREAHQAADVVRVFAATEEATRALGSGATPIAGTANLAALLPEISALLHDATESVG
jgi:hypothetical protein